MNKKIESRELDLVSVVFIFDPNKQPKALSGDDIAKVEQKLDERFQLGQVAGPSGLGVQIAIPRRQIDINFYPDRIETRSQSPQLDENVAEQMMRLFDGIVPNPDDFSWRSAGYNYILRVNAEEPIVARLKKAILKPVLEKRLHRNVIGLTPWIWVESGEATLWLRLEPYPPGDILTTRLSVNANFSISLATGKLLSGNVHKDRLIKFRGELDQILEALGL
ncbi:MAG: hypothetical protein Q7K03_06705 [Dehalococcoidia bacterium]|nr:hypothetical protein [Dehalococcoidia bacterium]